MKKWFKKTWCGQLIRSWIILSKKADRDNRWLQKNHPDIWFEQIANQQAR